MVTYRRHYPSNRFRRIRPRYIIVISSGAAAHYGGLPLRRKANDENATVIQKWIARC